MLSFRGRFHPSRWRSLPKVFPNGLGTSPNVDELRERAGLAIRSVAYGAAGVLVGQGVGFALGARKSTKIIKEEGNYEAIEQVMKKVQKDIMKEYGDGKNGQPREITPAQRRKLQGVAGGPGGQGLQREKQQQDSSAAGDFAPDSSSEGDTSRLARTFKRDAPQNRSGGGVWGETPFAKELGNEPQRSYETAFASPDATPKVGLDGGRISGGDAGQTQQQQQDDRRQRTRWEELRGQRDSRDSAWEKIRQDRGRQSYNSSTSSSRESEEDSASLLNDRDLQGPC